MRGFSELTRALDDTQYLANLIEEYLSTMTRVVEQDRASSSSTPAMASSRCFLPELSAVAPARSSTASSARPRARCTASSRRSTRAGVASGRRVVARRFRSASASA
jgi:hypothetical protein